MSEEKYALDVNKTFAEAGSFYISNMYSKNRDMAISFVCSGLATGIKANTENLINNICNNGSHIFKCIDKDFVFSQSSIDYSQSLPTINATLDINVNTIDTYLKNKIGVTYVAGIDFIQILDSNTSSPTYGKFIKIQFLNPEVGTYFSNLDKYIFNITGTYTRDSEVSQNVFKSYINADYCPVGYNTITLSNYIGGSKQSVGDYLDALNALNNSYYLEGSWKIVYIDTAYQNVQFVKLDENYEATSENKCIFIPTKIPSFYGVGDIIENNYFPLFVEGYTYNYANSNNTPSNVDSNQLALAFNLGNPIIYLYINTNLLTTNNISKMQQAAKQLLPIGYTLIFLSNNESSNNT